MIGPSADVLSLVYLLAAAYTLIQLPRRWRSLTDMAYTADDRNLANRIGFLLLTPLGVLAHEVAHWLVAWEFGARNLSLHFRFYWGYVEYTGRLGSTPEWLIAAAGPGTSLILGLAAGYAALRLRDVWHDVAMGFAHATLLLVLVLYPGISVVSGVGDFRWIYNAATPALSAIAGAAHGAGILAYLLLVRIQNRRAKAAARAAFHARFAGRTVALRDEHAARLADLEATERQRRLMPEERQALAELRELQSWTDAHNRQVAAEQYATLAASPDARDARFDDGRPGGVLLDGVEPGEGRADGARPSDARPGGA
ncbi:MAG: hypothetical protein IT305_08040 [Chloroflexi bacterium]|nr:hypothetical protein [Chloroflexota bacterium]